MPTREPPMPKMSKLGAVAALNLADDDPLAALVLGVVLPVVDDDAGGAVPLPLDDHPAFLPGRRGGGGIQPARTDQGGHRRQRRHSSESHAFLHNEARARIPGSETSDAGSAQPAGTGGSLDRMADPKSPAADPGGAERRAKILERPSARTSSSFACSSPTSSASSRTSRSPTGSSSEALDGKIMFDGSSIEGFVRIEESDMYLRPDLSTFQVFPWTDTTGERVGRLICDIAQPRRQPVRRLPAHDPEERHRAGRRARLHDDGGPRDRVLPLPAPRRQADDRDARRGRLLRPRADRPRRGRPPRDRPRARADGHRTSRRRTTRSRPASTRSTSTTTTC